MSSVYSSLSKPSEVKFVNSETESVSAAVKTFCSLRRVRRCSAAMPFDSPPAPHHIIALHGSYDCGMTQSG